ncbi:hypothetical protein HS088_TW03G00949 [Tripterygium wilfordii]|uniref:Uncharacterized protein n=1 Tax=Tripterygium wilfordii TaxID=458696 RepID=A0A7J7DW60_TRIWF|nr:uncharacterized protein LOC119995246 [Tripterygium wilfordii]KAF5750610.1 hypothetical protein HS088_TW03G00949 [Tripterygium wilfordii]
MESMGVGFMAVFAVSGSVVLIARQLHKRLVSDFMKKIEFELTGSARCNGGRKVKFAEDVMEPSSNNKEYRRRPYLMRSVKGGGDEDEVLLVMEDKDSQNVKVKDKMPPNWQILYEGKYKALQSYNV